VCAMGGTGGAAALAAAANWAATVPPVDDVEAASAVRDATGARAGTDGPAVERETAVRSAAGCSSLAGRDGPGAGLGAGPALAESGRVGGAWAEREGAEGGRVDVEVVSERVVDVVLVRGLVRVEVASEDDVAVAPVAVAVAAGTAR